MFLKSASAHGKTCLQDLQLLYVPEDLLTSLVSASISPMKKPNKALNHYQLQG